VLVGFAEIFITFILLEILFLIILGLSVSKFSHISLDSAVKYFVSNTIIAGISLYGIFGIFFISKSSSFAVLKHVFENFILADDVQQYLLIISVIL